MSDDSRSDASDQAGDISGDYNYQPSTLSSGGPSDSNLAGMSSRSSTLNMPSLYRRVRSRGRGRGRVRSALRGASSDESDTEFAPYGPTQTGAIRFSTRNQRNSYIQSSRIQDTPSSDDNEITEPVDGPPIETILCRNTDIDAPKFLVKLKGQSIIHSSLVSELELKRGKLTHPILTNFLNTSEAFGDVRSNLGKQFLDPLGCPVSPELFCIERVMSHRYSNRENAFAPEILDTSRYIPGIPTDTIPPLEHLMPFENPLIYGPLPSGLFVTDSGECILSQTDQIEKQPTMVYTNISEGIEFLVKWRNQPERNATWETPQSLRGKDAPFAAANLAQAEKLIQDYWKRVHSVPTEYKGRGIILTEDQKEQYEKLTAHRGLSRKLVSGSGVRTSVALFLETTIPRTALIVADDVKKWQKLIANVTHMIAIVFPSDNEDIMTFKQYELNNRGNQRFDILIITPEALLREPDLAKKVSAYAVVYETVYAKDVSSRLGDGYYHIYVESFPLPRETYRLVYCEDLFSATVHQRLRDGLKNKNTRKTALRGVQTLFYELVQIYSHPFLIPSLETKLTDSGRKPWRETALSVSGKLKYLVENVQPGQLTIIIAESLAALRIIAGVFQDSSIKTMYLNSMVTSELVPEPLPDLKDCVILMTRDFTSPILDSLTPDSIILFDIGENSDSDESLIKFLGRHGAIVDRLVYDHSMERELLMSDIPYRDVTSDEAELYVRAAIVLTQPGRPVITRPPELFSLINPSRIPLAGEVSASDFWESFFSSTHFCTQGKYISLKKSDVIHIYDLLITHLYGNWDRIAAEAKRPVSEIEPLCQAIAVYLLSTLDRAGLAHRNLTSAIVFRDFMKKRYEGEFDDQGNFWQKYVNVSPLFTEQKFTKILLNRQVEFFDRLERHYVLNAFLIMRGEDAVPFRFQVLEGAELTSARYVTTVIKTIARYGPIWSLIREKTGYIKVDERQHEEAFNKIYSCALQDVMSSLLHAHPRIDSPYIEAIEDILKYGPYSRPWTEGEVKVVLSTISDFLFPVLGQTENDLLEFQSLTMITAKSSEMIKLFLQHVTPELMRPNNASSTTLAPEIMQTDGRTPGPVITKHSRDQLVYYIKVMHKVRSLALCGVRECREKDALPEKWDIECDTDLIYGICQFGLGKLENLPKVIPQKPMGKVYDFYMRKGLPDFGTNDRANNELLKRLKQIIVVSGLIPRSIIPWGTTVRRINLTLKIQTVPTAQTAPPKDREDRKRAATKVDVNRRTKQRVAARDLRDLREVREAGDLRLSRDANAKKRTDVFSRIPVGMRQRLMALSNEKERTVF